MARLHRQPVRVIETRAGPRELVQVRQVAPVLPGWRAYAVTALGPDRDDGPLHLTVYDRVDDLPDGPLAA
ncbi:MAG: hypothetical protein FIB00_10750 [Chloroflexi bacterium]|nr:hypothetical protein [Chloroflexota bacterium]PWB45725.1 MAG: hypothetical protein C3F10_05365 [Dehalococcoidia bacterium]